MSGLTPQEAAELLGVSTRTLLRWEEKGIKHAEAYLGKPWQPRELLDTINRVLLDAKSLPDSRSADAWTEYAVLILNMMSLYECRADAWTK